MSTGLSHRLASKACFLTVMTFLPAALPLLGGCPRRFHVWFKSDTPQPAPGTQCLRAPPPSQRGQSQRPGRGLAPELGWRGPGPGVCSAAGKGAGLGGLKDGEPRPGPSWGTVGRVPTHGIPREGWGAPAHPGSHALPWDAGE